MLIYMMNFAEVREEDEQYRSPLDMLFRALEEEQPNHVAVKQYKAIFKQAAGKTAKSIFVSCRAAGHLQYPAVCQNHNGG